MNRQNEQNNSEEAYELDEVLEPYEEEEQQWSDDGYYQQQAYEQAYQDEYPEAYTEGYEEFYDEEYSEEHEAADSESRFRLAMGVFDLASIFVGIAVILVLSGMLITLVNWLKTDILHSALLLQSGLQ